MCHINGIEPRLDFGVRPLFEYLLKFCFFQLIDLKEVLMELSLIYFIFLESLNLFSF